MDGKKEKRISDQQIQTDHKIGNIVLKELSDKQKELMRMILSKYGVHLPACLVNHLYPTDAEVDVAIREMNELKDEEKMTEGKKCWICGRTTKELSQYGETISFERVCSLEEMYEHDFEIYLCEICSCILSHKTEDHIEYLANDGILKIKLEL